MSLKIKKAINPVWKRGVNRVPKNFEFFFIFSYCFDRLILKMIKKNKKNIILMYF
jgi:hypothetical protein